MSSKGYLVQFFFQLFNSDSVFLTNLLIYLSQMIRDPLNLELSKIKATESFNIIMKVQWNTRLKIGPIIISINPKTTQYTKYFIQSFSILLPIVNKLKQAGIKTAPILMTNGDKGSKNDNRNTAIVNTIVNCDGLRVVFYFIMLNQLISSSLFNSKQDANFYMYSIYFLYDQFKQIYPRKYMLIIYDYQFKIFKKSLMIIIIIIIIINQGRNILFQQFNQLKQNQFPIIIILKQTICLVKAYFQNNKTLLQLNNKIAQKMDSRIYFHQNRRPRYNNPTYISSNVNNSLTFFNSKRNQPQQTLFYGYSHNQKINTNNQSIINNERTQNKNIDNYNINHSQANGNTHNTIVNSIQNRQYRGDFLNNRSSHLSSYGSNSLSLNQKDIFNKQNQKFDIISMRPKNFDTSIRQYPAFTVQNKDELYYKRMGQNLNKPSQYQQASLRMQNNSKNQNHQPMIAGKHTYGSITDRNKQYKNKFTGYTGEQNLPNLNTNPQYPVDRQSQKNKYFNPKMLSHMDQLSSLS